MTGQAAIAMLGLQLLTPGAMSTFRPITESLAVSAGTQSVNGGTVVFADGGGVSFGLSGSSQLTASVGAGATATGNLGGIVAGGKLASSGTVEFADSNGVTFGLQTSNQVVTAAFDAIKSVSAGSTRITGGEVVFASSNGVSFGISGQTLTASVTTPAMSYFENYKGAALGANAAATASASGNLSLQHVFIPCRLTATQLDLLAHFSANSASRGSYTWRVGVYEYRNSTQASLLSSAFATLSFTTGSASTTASVYGGHAGTRFRSISLGTWGFTPGEYMVGVMASASAPAAGITVFGQSSVSVLPDVGATVNYSKYWGDGVLGAGTGAFPATIHRSAIVQTGSIAMRQPYFRLVGTF